MGYFAAFITFAVVNILMRPFVLCNLEMTADPPVIKLGITDRFTVNCTFDKDSTSHLSNLISLFVSRSNDSERFKEIAAVNVYSPSTVHVLSQDKSLVASGQASPSGGRSYISLTWASPSPDEGGFYKCTAQGVDSVGHNTVLGEILTAGTEKPQEYELINKVRQLDAKLREIGENVTALETRVSSMQGCCSLNPTSRRRRESRKLDSPASPQMASYYYVFFPVFATVGGHYYYIPRLQLWDFDEANSLCTKHGGYLAEIDDAIEYRSIVEFLAGNRVSLSVGVSGTRNEGTDRWTYQHSLRVMRYVEWMSQTDHRPVNNGTNGNCVEINPLYDWKMNKVSCSMLVASGLLALCEMNSSIP